MITCGGAAPAFSKSVCDGYLPPATSTVSPGLATCHARLKLLHGRAFAHRPAFEPSVAT